MRSSHAACISAAPSNLISKIISLVCAVTLCCGLVPSAAFAANDDSLSLIPEGEQGAVSIASHAEGGSDDAVSHSASDGVSSADGDGAASTSEDVSDIEGSDTVGSAEAGDNAFGEGTADGAVAAIPAADLNIINQVEPLQVVAQVESTRNYFLAQTLESTRTVPVVSAKLPIDTGMTSEPNTPAEGGSTNGVEGDPSEATEGGDDSDESDLAGSSTIAAESTVVGSFEYLGMTFAIEAGGESVALVAADYNKLPETFIENQAIVIPDAVTADGIDYYSVTRIADGSFASFKEEIADPDYIGCEALFSNEELLDKAGVDLSEVEQLLMNNTVQTMASAEENGDASAPIISIEANRSEFSDESLDADSAVPIVISSTQKLSTDFELEASDNNIHTIATMEENVATLDDGTACAFADPFADRAGILVLGIPASLTTIESNAFDGFETLQYFVVSDKNENYTSFDGALYNADLTQLQLVPEGRTGALLIPADAAAAAENDAQSNVILVEAASVQEPTVYAHESIDALLARLLPNIPQEERSSDADDAEVLESTYVPIEPSETDSVTSMETIATYDAKSSELFDIYGLNASTTLYQVGGVSSSFTYLYATSRSFADDTLTLTSTERWTGVERIFFDSHRLILSYNYYSSEAKEQRTGYKGFGLTTSGGITRVQFKTSKSSTATLYDVPRGTQGMSVAEMRALTGSSSSAIYLSFSTTAWTPSVMWLSPYSGTSSTSISIPMHRAGNLADPAPTVYFETASMNLPAAPSTTFSPTNTLSSADRIFFKNNRMIIRHFYKATELGNVQRFAYLSYGLTCDGGITGIKLRTSDTSNASYLTVAAGDVGVGFDEIKAKLDTSIESGATIYVEFTTAASSSSAVATNWIANGGKWADNTDRKSLWLAKGASSSGPSPTPTRTGYKFYGWSTSSSALPTTTGEHAPKTSVNVTANGVYYAVWGIIKKVTLDQQGATTQASKKELYYVFGSNELWTNDTCTTKYSTTTNVVPERTNYVFAGYYSAAGTGTSTQYMTKDGAKTSNVTASLGGNASGTLTMYANWIPVSTITVYKHMGNDNAESAKLYYKHGGDTLYTNIACTTAWTASIYKLTRTGYTFGGWTSAKNGSTLYLNTTPAVQTALKNAYKTSTSPSTAVEIHAKWTADTYTITYSLDGGSASNPATYTIETATFTLKNPTKAGYTFAGWTGTGLSAASKTVKIEKGSTGSRSYTASWTKDAYTITYALAGGQWPSNATKPGSFSIDTATFTITDPTRAGYTFAGWTGSGLSSATKALKIEKGSTGSRTYTATWTPVEYKITYSLAGGSLPAGTTNPTKYTIETKTFTLNNPTKDGFIFTGWTLGGSTELLEAAEVTIGSTGDRAYTANWTVIPSSDNTFAVYPYSEDGNTASIDLYSVGWIVPGQSYQDACYKDFPEDQKTSFADSGIKGLDRIYFENGRLVIHHFYTHMSEQRDSYIGKGLTKTGGITGIQYSLTNGKDAVFYDMPIGRGGIGLTEIMAQTRASSPPSNIYLRFLTEPQAYPSFKIYPYNPNETVSFYAVGNYSTPGISYQQAAYNALPEAPNRTMDKSGINSVERLYFENGRLIVHAYYVADGVQRDCYIAYALTNAGGITRVQYSLTPNETDSSKIYDIEVGGGGISLSELREITGESPNAIYLKFSTEARTPAEAFTVYVYTGDGTKASLLHSAGSIVPGQNYHNASTRNLSAEAGSSISNSRCEDRIFFENGRLILHYYYATEVDGVMYQRNSYVAYGLTCAGGITRLKYSISNAANAAFKEVPVGPGGIGAAEIGANAVYLKFETGAPNDAFAVNWIGNGGNWADGSTQKASWEKKGSSLSGPGTTPEREGYKFYGWATSSTAAPSEAAETITPSGTTTYYAIWGHIVTVTLDQRSATEDAATTTLYYAFGDRQFYTNAGCTNAYAAATVIPSRTGYTFDGYYTKANGEGDRYLNEKGEMTQAVTASLWSNASSEATLKANWTVNTYNITWDANEGVNGTIDDTYAKQAYGSTIKIPGAPSRTGYDFVGWYTKATGGDKLAANAKVGAEDQTYYAHWDEAAYTVVFSKGDGDFEDPWPTGTFKYQSDEMTAPDTEDISRYGFTLAGWTTTTNPANTDIVTTGVGTIAPGGTTKVSALYAGSTNIPESITLYPVWSADTYTISLESNEGVYDEAGLADLMDALANDPKAEFGGNQMTYTILTPAFTIPGLTKTGWVFDGWSTDGGNTKRPTVMIDPAADGFTLTNLSYEACWSISAYVVKYYEEEGSAKEAAFMSDVVSSFDVDGPSTMSIPDPVRKGWTFTGWSGPGLVGSENKGKDVIVNLEELITDELPKGPDEVALAYYAHWTQDTYTVTYILNDDDYNYLGTFSSEYKGFDGNTALDANDDGTYTDTYRYDETKEADELALPFKTGNVFDLTRPGYVFAGWVCVDDDEVGETIIESIDPKNQAEDLTFKACWNPVVSVALPVTSESIDFRIDAATGQTEEVVTGTPQELTLSSATPVATELTVSSSAGKDDVSALFQELGDGDGSTTLALINSLGFSFDASKCDYVASDKKELVFGRANGSDGVVVLTGSEAYATKGLTSPEILPVKGAFALMQASEDASGFSPLKIDLSKIRVKSEQELQSAGISKLHLADVVWTVRLKGGADSHS